MRISITSGLITNSSSVVHGFDKRLLENTKVKAFMECYGISEGYVARTIWNRGESCVVVSDEQKELLKRKFAASEYADEPSPGCIYGDHKIEDGEFAVLYGDEYTTVASVLCDLLSEAYKEMNPDCGDRWRASKWHFDFN